MTACFSAGADRFDPAAPIAGGTGRFLILDGSEDALEERILLHAPKELPPLGPIDADGNRLCAARTQERLKQRHRFTWRNSQRPLPREKIGDAFVARYVTFATEHAPIDRQRRQTKRLTMMRERVDKGVGRAVISLRRIAEDARDGRKHDEAIELHFPRRLVQQPCTLRLWCDHGSHPLAGERGKRRIVDHHREMKDTAQRLPARFNLCEQSLGVVRRTNVRRNHANLDAAFLQAGHKLFGLGSGRTAAAG